MIPQIDEIFIDPAAAGSGLARRLVSLLPQAALRRGAPPPPVKGEAPRKKTLFLTNHRGRFLKACPGTSGYICCGYKVLNLVSGCPMDCTYCILQAYLNRPGITVHANWEDCLVEIDEHLRERPGTVLRIGTGELADSLALEPLTGMARDLLEEVLKRDRVVLELKTKSTNIQGLTSLHCAGRALVSWSLNAEPVVASDEIDAPSLESRLRAAADARRAGYRIGLHFDPLVRFAGWRKGYGAAVDAVYDHLSPGDIAWISLGALRYPPALDTIIRKRFPRSRLPLGELVPGLDGKLRYFRPLRVEMFRYLYSEIVKRDDRAEIYLCMESPEVWRASLGRTPRGTPALSRRLDIACTGV